MKMKRTTRVSFSDKPAPRLSITLPQCWADLDETELRKVIEIRVQLAGEPAGKVYLHLFRYFTSLHVLRREGGVWHCCVTARRGRRVRSIMCDFAPELLAEQLEPLSFIESPGDVPVRLSRWHGARAVDAEFHGISFGDYLRLENLYQGFLMSKNPAALDAIAAILYPGICEKYIDDVFVMNLLQWVVQVKNMFARMWPNFFKQAGADVAPPDMMEVMNSEIRALTGGDIAKEDVIFASDCWRALTELDYLAKDAEEMKKLISKHK